MKFGAFSFGCAFASSARDEKFGRLHWKCVIATRNFVLRDVRNSMDVLASGPSSILLARGSS